MQSRLHSEERSEGCHISGPTPALCSPSYLLFSFSALPPSCVYAFCIMWSSFLLTHVILVSRLTSREFYTCFIDTIMNNWLFFISLSFLYRSIIETQHQLQREKNLWKADKTGLDIRRRPLQISKFPHPPHPSNGPLFSFPGIHKTTRFPCLTQHMYPFGIRGLEAANTEFRELGNIF